MKEGPILALFKSKNNTVVVDGQLKIPNHIAIIMDMMG